MTAYPADPSHAIGTASDEIINSYSSYVWAKSERHARLLAKRRNIGEVVIGGSQKAAPYPYLSELLRKRSMRPKDKIDAIHAATFLGYLLMQSCGAPPCDVIGDEGLVHQVIHCLAFGTPKRAHLAEVASYFERRVPGYVKT